MGNERLSYECHGGRIKLPPFLHDDVFIKRLTFENLNPSKRFSWWRLLYFCYEKRSKLSRRKYLGCLPFIKANMKFEEIETARLTLRKINPEVLERIYKELSDAEQMAVMGIYSLEKLREEQSKFKAGMETYNKSCLYFKMVHKETEEVIGGCGFHTWYTQHDRAELGYEIFQDKDKDQGYMKEALAAVVDYGFSVMKLRRMEAFISPYNVASVKLVERLNFVKEGLLRETYLVAGHYEDSQVYALLKRDYLKRNL